MDMIGHNNPPKTPDEKLAELKAKGFPYLPAKIHYCHNCERTFQHGGIAKHRVMHKNRRECVVITKGSWGKTITESFDYETSARGNGKGYWGETAEERMID